MRLLLTSLFLGISLLINAQILITDRASIESDTSKVLLGSAAFSFELKNRGATEAEESVFKGIDFNTDLVYLGEKHAILFINQLEYYSVTNGDLLSTGYSHVRTVFLRKNKVSPEFYGQIQYDAGRNLNHRYLAGIGARITVLHTGQSNLNFGLGLMLEKEEWVFTDVITDKNLRKSNAYIGFTTKLNESLQLSFTNYYQVGKDADLWRSRISGDILLVVNLSKRIALMNRFSYQFENQPIIPISKFIYSYTNGLTLSF